MGNTFKELLQQDVNSCPQCGQDLRLPPASVLRDRLQKACDYLRELQEKSKAPDQYMIDELEAPLEEK